MLGGADDSGYGIREAEILKSTTNPGPESSEHRPIVFGEALLDRLPDSEILGGASFNVAWHLRGFGEAPFLVSRVGDDDRGRRVLDAMGSWGLDTAGVRIDAEAPTGLVDIRESVGGHAFDILPDRAYDRIEADQVPPGTRTPLLCHGTLALRTESGRDALRRIHAATGTPLFCDLNLRPPWDHPEAIAWSLAHADWLKLSDEELARLGGRRCVDHDGCATAARAVRDEHGHRIVFVTRGAEGALAVTRDGEVIRASAPPVEDLVDTVGAGDAFTSVVILGLLRRWALPESLERAVAFAARVCARRGATSSDRSLYATLEPSAEGEPGA